MLASYLASSCQRLDQGVKEAGTDTERSPLGARSKACALGATQQWLPAFQATCPNTLHGLCLTKLIVKMLQEPTTQICRVRIATFLLCEAQPISSMGLTYQIDIHHATTRSVLAYSA